MSVRLPRRRGPLGLLLVAGVTCSLLVGAPAGAADPADEPSPSPSPSITEPSPDVTEPTVEPEPSTSPTTRAPTPSPRSATPSPTPTPTPTATPRPPRPRAQSVSVRVESRKSLPTIRAASNSRSRTTFVLQRWNGRKWITVAVRKSNTKGAIRFSPTLAFSTFRVTARGKSGWKWARSRTINTRSHWKNGYPSLGIKNASIAVTPLGGGPTFTVGDHRSDFAWSTIKVPIVVIADSRRTGRAADKQAAIRYSNNAAARRVYDSLGRGRSSHVNRHLRAHGDSKTRISSAGTGLTKWHVSHQSRYASRIACTSKARQTRIHMKNARPSYPFGLLQTKLSKRTSQKIGYGGSEVRQLAIVKLRDGRTYGVSILADGGFKSARGKVDRIARWVSNRLEHLPARKC